MRLIMGMARWMAILATGLALALPVRGQQAEPTTLGFQLRGSLAMGDLRSAVGGSGSAKPGFGGSLVLEEDFLDGIRGRLGLGTDVWLKGSWMDRPGVYGSVTASHLTAEWVRLLRPDADAPLLGPYVLAGVGLYSWSITSDDTLTNVTTTRQVTHMAVTFGFGWRLSAHNDVELKALVGRVDPNFMATALTLGYAFRY